VIYPPDSFLSDSAASAISVNCYNNLVGNVNPRNVAGTTVNPRRTAPLRSSRNLALTTAGASSTCNSGTTGANLLNIASAANTLVNGYANKDFYLDYDMSTILATAAATVNAPPQATVNLGRTVTFDRLVLRTYQINTGGSVTPVLPFTPGRIQIEGTTQSTSAGWELIYDSGEGYQINSVITDIVFDKPQTYRQIRVSMLSPRGNAPGYGVVQYSATSDAAPYYGARLVGSGPAAYNPGNIYRLGSFELYSFSNSVYLDIPGEGTITSGTTNYTKSTYAGARTIALASGDSLKLTFTPKVASAPFAVLRDGVDITADLDSSNAITLTDVTKDTVISLYCPSIVADYLTTNYTAKAVVNIKNARLIVAAYDANNRLIGIRYADSVKSAPEWRMFSVDATDLLKGVNYKTVKTFLWDGVTYAPVVM